MMKQSGFTLLELLIALALAALVMGISAANLLPLRKALVVEQASQQFSQDIQYARARALARSDNWRLRILNSTSYVEGNLDEMILQTGGAGSQLQIYTFKQGTKTWRIEVDYDDEETKVIFTNTGVSPAINQTTDYDGLPNGNPPFATPFEEGGGANGQIFVRGQITNLYAPVRTGTVASSAPDHPPPTAIPAALSLETQLNITASGLIGLTSDIVYECDPTMITNSSYTSSRPHCNMPELPTVLGMMSLTDNIIIENAPVKAPNDIRLWGSYLSGTTGKGLAVESYNSRGNQGKMRVFGGLIQQADQLRGTVNSSGSLVNGYLEGFDYDQRFASGTVAPPNFPSAGEFSVKEVIPLAYGFREY